MKTCTKCNITKELVFFDKESQNKDGLRNDCKQCRKLYRDSKKEIMKEYHKRYFQEHKDVYRERGRKWRENNKERVSEIAARANKKHRKKNNEYKKRKYHERKASDPLFNLIYRVRNRTKNAVRAKRFRKDFKYPDYIGCSREELKVHIEQQFTEGMTWDKFMAGEIHIDHIIPIGKAESPEEVFKLSHYTNLRPLWAKDNLKKGAK